MKPHPTSPVVERTLSHMNLSSRCTSFLMVAVRGRTWTIRRARRTASSKPRSRHAAADRRDAKAVLVISAHWEEPEFTLTSQPSRHGLRLLRLSGLHLPDSRTVRPATGARGARAGLSARPASRRGSTRERGFDHGTFTPLNSIYPDADVPGGAAFAQARPRSGDAPALGRALAPLRDQGVLIVGSGLSYHNLRQFFSPAAVGGPSQRIRRLAARRTAGAAAPRIATNY